jgi:pyruvate dehydrogenase (quinone)
MAAQAALSKRGVAVLILPVDVSKAKVADEPAFAVHRATPVLRPSDTELDHIAQVLSAGTKIAIYGGSGCEGAHDEIIALADRLKAPIAHTSRAKDFLEYDNPFNVGMTGVLGIASGYHALMHCNTLLLLGCDFAWRQFYPDKARIVQVDIDPTHLGRRHPVELGVVGDVKATVAALLPRLAARTDRAFLDDCTARKTRAVESLDKHATITDRGKIHPQYLASLIDHHADADAIFTADGGEPTPWLLRHVKVNGTRRTLISLTHGTIGIFS